MRFFLKSLLAILIAAVIAGLLTYPAWLLASQFGTVRIDRVMRRVGMIVLAVMLIAVLRRAGLANREVLGYAMPRPQFIRQMALGFAAGLLLMMPLIAVLFSSGVRSLAPEIDTALIGKLLLRGVLAGLLIAFVEETFMRGAMFSVIKRESGIKLAIALPALLYAAVHFLGGSLRIPNDQVTFMSGIAVAADTFQRFTAPLQFVDTFFALAALGVLLALIRLRTGAIAACIGLHAGGVCVIGVVQGLSVVDRTAPMAALVGSYDGVIGWLACGWITLIALVYARWAPQPITPRSPF